MDGISYHHICSFSPNLRSPEVTPSPDLRNQFFVSLIPWSLGTQLGPRGPWLSGLAPVTLVLSRKVHIAAAAAAAACPAAYVTAARRASLASGKDLWRVHCSVTEEENKAQEHLESDRIFSIFTLFSDTEALSVRHPGRHCVTRQSAPPCFAGVTSAAALCACPSFQPQFMSAICRGRLMLVTVPNKSTFLGPMQLDPTIIREKLFRGIDEEYNVSFSFS